MLNPVPGTAVLEYRQANTATIRGTVTAKQSRPYGKNRHIYYVFPVFPVFVTRRESSGVISA